jgi:penicillin-binding protein 2
MRTYLDGAPVETRPAMRFLAFGMAILLGASLLVVRLFAMQVGASTHFAALAAQNRAVLQAIPSTRGVVYDRKGKPLVSNVASYSVKIRPADLPESKRQAVVEALGALVGKDPTDINIEIDSNPGSRYDLVRVAADVDPTIANFIAESGQELPGVQVVIETRRHYEMGPLYSQILGYTGPINGDELADLHDQGYLPDDLLGRAGLEATYEDVLRGVYGIETVERDATGRKTQVLQTDREPVPGDSLRLTLDTREQQLAEKALRWGMKAAGLKRGVFIAMNPQTGEILAMVSLPTYDDNAFAEGISASAYQKILDDPNKPLLNHAVQAHYPPGSTYKMITAIAALADKKLTPTTELRTAGYLTIGTTKFVDWNGRGFGLCNLTCGFAHSSDTFFYQAAARVGIDRLAYWAHQFGLGERTGIDLLAEARGIVPSEQWKLDTLGEPIYPGDVYHAGIGQGYDTVSPIQLLNAYCAVANGGTLYKPQLVGDIIGPDGSVVRPFQPEVIRKIDIDSGVLKTMRVIARNVQLVRHTYNLVDLPIVMAGKTGTAEFGIPDAKGLLPYHTWFVGFVPKNPWKTASDPNGFKAVARNDANLAILAFAYDSNTRGNAATEIAKYFLQLHFGITKDYRNFRLLEKTNFYNSSN